MNNIERHIAQQHRSGRGHGYDRLVFAAQLPPVERETSGVSRTRTEVHRSIGRLKRRENPMGFALPVVKDLPGLAALTEKYAAEIARGREIRKQIFE